MARLGSLRWLRESGVDLAAGDSFIDRMVRRRARPSWAWRSIKSLARLVRGQGHGQARRGEGRPATPAAGLKTYLLTGDNALTAASIAKQIGIAAENVFAEVRPEQKAEFVKKLQAAAASAWRSWATASTTRRRLEQADLGIAVSRASDIAREAADIILLKSEIEAVPEALGLARATLRTIKQNLFWAFFYNAIGVPLAALGFMSPVLCAAAMGVSDLVVIGNALRLRRWR